MIRKNSLLVWDLYKADSKTALYVRDLLNYVPMRKKGKGAKGNGGCQISAGSTPVKKRGKERGLDKQSLRLQQL